MKISGVLRTVLTSLEILLPTLIMLLAEIYVEEITLQTVLQKTTTHIITVRYTIGADYLVNYSDGDLKTKIKELTSLNFL